ncbi:hypothetical protein yc1106_09375 [Curvularia clavata]|uniref:Uncharacterized protein n=1 Tax=Curvularia clavata TaxID=95742 RepID=A0A9Q9DY19_CURCL|nr:hypothetical protein yc1106_09375 [Curvularia clavata]
MHSEDAQAGTVTKETLKLTGWEEDAISSEDVSKDWHESLGTADGLMNTDNEVTRVWDHDNHWEDNEGRKRRYTEASMGNSVNGNDGYIIAGSNYVP